METTKPKINLYPAETAGRLMISNVPTIDQQATITDVEKLLFKQANYFETINYIYVLDNQQKLLGALSIKELYRTPRTTPLFQLTLPKLITVRAHTDQERVALLSLQHNIKAVPVIDKTGVFLGVVPSDTILQILHNENIEDVLRSAGAGKIDNPAVNIIKAGAALHFRKRLPWLLLGLAGGVIAALVVRIFESALQEHLILAAFIPAIVYMADAVGSQTQTIFIRSLALDRTLNLANYVIREIKVTLGLALLLGSLSFVFAWLWLGGWLLGLVLALAMAITIVAAMLVAMLMPWLLQKSNFDPAIASGPFATVIRDIMSLLIYFGVASWLL